MVHHDKPSKMTWQVFSFEGQPSRLTEKSTEFYTVDEKQDEVIR